MSDKPEREPTIQPDVSTGHESVDIDVSKLPALPPVGSKEWRGSRKSGRWRGVGCGCGLVVLIAAIITAYAGLRQKVWSSFDEVRHGLERSILVEVAPEEKQRLLENLRLYKTVVSDSDDPYPAIGRFVSAGREALADFVVDPDEAERINQLLEKEMIE